MNEPRRPMTAAGFKALSAEYNELMNVERPKVVAGVATAAAEGDRSENAEYIYGKKRLREIDKRLQYLGKLLKDVEVVDPSTLRGDTVSFGATVVIEGDDGKRATWTIVGEGEADTRDGTISWKSPMARALLGKKVGDTVTVERPAGEIEVEVVALRFGAAKA
jgi:transcription elongation factor GreB